MSGSSPCSPGNRYTYALPQGSNGISCGKYGPSHRGTPSGWVRNASSPCSVVGNRLVSSLYTPSAVWKELIWARAAVARDRPHLPEQPRPHQRREHRNDRHHHEQLNQCDSRRP